MNYAVVAAGGGGGDGRCQRWHGRVEARVLTPRYVSALIAARCPASSGSASIFLLGSHCVSALSCHNSLHGYTPD